MLSSKKIVLTCEHGGNFIPKIFRPLFRHQRRLLSSHRGWDIGALSIAQLMQKTLRVPLQYSTVSRLLVDLNRFPTSTTLFSEITGKLTSKQKQKILAAFYTPYWKKLDRLFNHYRKKNVQIIHVGVHSMTGQLNGRKRDMNLALLYDPQRPAEKKFCNEWIKQLKAIRPSLKIARNRPYRGTGDGVTCFHRNLFPSQDYLGIELEINQSLLALLDANGKKDLAQLLMTSLVRTTCQNP